MNPVKIFRTVLWWAVMLAGLVASSVSGYQVIKGPFLGRGVLEPTPLMIYSGAFLIGMIVFAVGASKLVNLYSG